MEPASRECLPASRELPGPRKGSREPQGNSWEELLGTSRRPWELPAAPAGWFLGAAPGNFPLLPGSSSGNSRGRLGAPGNFRLLRLAGSEAALSTAFTGRSSLAAPRPYWIWFYAFYVFSPVTEEQKIAFAIFGFRRKLIRQRPAQIADHRDAKKSTAKHGRREREFLFLDYGRPRRPQKCRFSHTLT